MKKIAVCAMILGFSLIAYATSFVQAETASSTSAMMGMRCVTPWEMFKFMMDLKITDAQKTAFKDLKKATDTDSEAIRTQIKDQQELMTDAFLAAEIDTAAAETQIDAMQALQTQYSDILLHAELKAVQILTADQRTLILAMVKKLRECEKARPGWMSMSKPAYFSLIMPNKTFLN
jgi:Spy/CpxP family protein refolding chaperone